MKSIGTTKKKKFSKIKTSEYAQPNLVKDSILYLGITILITITNIKIIKLFSTINKDFSPLTLKKKKPITNTNL